MVKHRPLAQVVGDALAEPVAAARRLVPLVVDSGDDADLLHDLRVAVRRTTSGLRTFAPVLAGPTVDALRADLAWLADPLGGARDLDVQVDLVTTRVRELGHDPSTLAFVARLDAERVRARRDVTRRLTAPRASTVLDDLQQFAAAPAVRRKYRKDDPTDRLRRLARRPWVELRDAVGALDDHPADAALHDVRLRAKRARYAIDAVGRVTGLDASKLVRRLAKLQGLLGDHQDAAVLRALLGGAAAGSDAAEAYVLGELAGWFAAEQEAVRETWRDAWDAAAKPGLRAWMRSDAT